MDRDRFDALVKLLAASGSRRATVGALLGTLLGGAVDGVDAKRRGNARGNDKDRDRDKRRDTDRQPDQPLQAERRGKHRKRKHNKKRRGNDGGQPEPPPPECCGTESCPNPEPGSTSAGCDFAGRAFAGQDHNGSIFHGIDGRGANFTATDNRGSVFAEACLQGATFRNARLGGTTWGKACLFDADFFGANLGDDPLFAEARFCHTVMPDGSRNDRDCARATACCQPRSEPGPACQPNGGACAQHADCCGGNCFARVCVDRPRFCDNTTCPGNAIGCCDDNCCEAPANQCTQFGLCCAPNCTGRACGADGCGGGGTCGTCPDNLTCDEQTGLCECTRQPVGGSCSGNGDCCSDNCCGGACCDAGGLCCGGANCCPPPVGKCCELSCCGATATCCGGVDGFQICCEEPLLGFCNGTRCISCFPGCVQGQRCSATGECVCDATSCPNGCCSAGPGNPGTCLPKPSGQPCPCTPQNCPDGCCDGTVCHTPPSDQFCGTDGATCATCTALQQCINGACCTRECASGQCGTVQDGCGGTIGCGSCPVGNTPSCKDGVCASCPDTCPNTRFCLNLTTGDTVCSNTIAINCVNNCSSNADCTGDEGTVCIASYTDSGQFNQNQTFTVQSFCGMPAMCTIVQA
jgi:hypothetical protein